MDFATLAKAAVELGVIPALALFLVVAMHRQNRQLTQMLADREKHNNDMIQRLVVEVIQFGKASVVHMGGESK